MTVIRPLQPGDVDVVVEFSIRAWQPNFESFTRVMGPEIFRRIYPDWKSAQAAAVTEACRAEGSLVWVADAEGRPVGFVVVVVHRLNPETESGEIYMIAVDPDHQNQGIGLDLTNFAVNRITESGAQLAEIGTGGDPGHAAARHIYEKAGFTPMPQVRYYKAL